MRYLSIRMALLALLITVYFGTTKYDSLLHRLGAKPDLLMSELIDSDFERALIINGNICNVCADGAVVASTVNSRTLVVLPEGTTPEEEDIFRFTFDYDQQLLVGNEHIRRYVARIARCREAGEENLILTVTNGGRTWEPTGFF